MPTQIPREIQTFCSKLGLRWKLRAARQTLHERWEQCYLSSRSWLTLFDACGRVAWVPAVKQQKTQAGAIVYSLHHHPGNHSNRQYLPHELTATEDDDEVGRDSNDDLLVGRERGGATDPLDELGGRLGEVEGVPGRPDGGDERPVAGGGERNHCEGVSGFRVGEEGLRKEEERRRRKGEVGEKETEMVTRLEIRREGRLDGARRM